MRCGILKFPRRLALNARSAAGSFLLTWTPRNSPRSDKTSRRVAIAIYVRQIAAPSTGFEPLPQDLKANGTGFLHGGSSFQRFLSSIGAEVAMLTE